jgi:hypothetical protein
VWMGLIEGFNIERLGLIEFCNIERLGLIDVPVRVYGLEHTPLQAVEHHDTTRVQTSAACDELVVGAERGTREVHPLAPAAEVGVLVGSKHICNMYISYV